VIVTAVPAVPAAGEIPDTESASRAVNWKLSRPAHKGNRFASLFPCVPISLLPRQFSEDVGIGDDSFAGPGAFYGFGEKRIGYPLFWVMYG